MNLNKLNELFKFSWAQAFSDDNGKTTIIPVASLYIIVIGGIGFIYGGVIKDNNLISQSVIMVTLGVSLLLGRKIVNGKSNDLPDVDKT